MLGTNAPIRLTTCLLACLLATSAQSQDHPPRRSASDLATPVRVPAAGAPIDVAGFAAPFMGDFDGDGVRDLLVGQLDYGRMRIYHNGGTNAAPEFDDWKWFHAGGRIAGIPAGCRVGFTPQLIDFDSDGRKDVLTGSFCGGLVYLYRQQADGNFAAAEVLENKHGNVQMLPIPYNATVFAHDWNGDGDLDLITGRSNYQIIENEGTRDAPVFGDPTGITCQNERISNGYVPPVVADWDHDGRDDLITGLGWDIVWYRGIGTAESLEFDEPRVLVSAEDLGPGSDAGPDAERDSPSKRLQAVCVTDFNADGRLDLLVGDHYYLTRELDDEQLTAYQDSSHQRSEARHEFYETIRLDTDDETRTERVTRFRTALDELDRLSDLLWVGGQASHSRMERHGGVWFYERLATLEE